jgi:hypothetical protein
MGRQIAVGSPTADCFSQCAAGKAGAGLGAARNRVAGERLVRPAYHLMPRLQRFGSRAIGSVSCGLRERRKNQVLRLRAQGRCSNPRRTVPGSDGFNEAHKSRLCRNLNRAGSEHPLRYIRASRPFGLRNSQESIFLSAAIQFRHPHVLSSMQPTAGP